MDVLAVVPLLVLVCAGAPGVLSALAVADLPVHAPEATSALALLSPYVRSQRASLIIIGQVNWTGAFLRGLGSETTWVVLQGEEDEAVFRKRFDDDVMETNIVAMVVADNPKDPASWLQKDHPGYARLLYWLTVGPGMEEAIPKIPHFSIPMCTRPVGMAVTAPNGSTTLYSVAQQDCGKNAPTLLKVDQWSTSRQSWQQTDAIFALFKPFCSEWQSPPANNSVIVFKLSTDGEESPFSRLFDIFVRNDRSLPRNLNLSSYASFNSNSFSFETMNFEVGRAREQCRLSVAYIEDGVVGRFDSRTVSIMTERKMYPVTVYVPAGLGPAVNPLGAVLVEFSPAVWLGTALATLSTAAALACTLRRDRGAALLLALAPLLGQAPGTPPPAGRALRPLLGVWLLVCVVLVAAYQGLLLGELSTERPRGEINSLRDLEASGLPVYLTWNVVGLGDNIWDSFPESLRRNKHSALMDKKTLRLVARHRNCAVITLQDRLVQRLVHSLTKPPHRKLHSFTIGSETLKIVAFWSRGSPLGERMALAYSRLDEAGILDHWEDDLDEGYRVLSARHLSALKRALPLSLQNMAPAFYVLLNGIVLASVVFVVELVTAKWGRAGQSP
ncbi:Ionotropic receptor 159 [Frankliniella occidentalis]|nr:Ionotropic receptor 159 [Frankliniella occidentalis]